MSAQNELAAKAGFLITKLFTEHAANIEKAKRNKATVTFTVEGKPGQKKLICDVSIPTVDESGCRVVYEPHAEVELENPDQGRLI